jgi:hypothetical protein
MPWWVVREGELGQIVSSLDPGQLLNLNVEWTTEESATKPKGAYGGKSYPTQHAAQVEATKLNNSESGLAPAASAAANAAASGTLSGLNSLAGNLTNSHTWERVAEFVVGVILMYVGIKALATPGGASVAQQNLKKTAKNVVFGPPKKIAKVAAPEVRVASRVAAKRVAPKATARVARHREYVKQYGTKKPYSPGKAANAAAKTSAQSARTAFKPKSKTPTQAELRAQLRARGNQLAPRVNPNAGGSIATSGNW